jgi:predicted DNA-binding protein (MmcQ/YjbR family)
MARDLATALRELCLAFPETDWIVSHGAPNFRVRGKSFATYQLNHHGDGRVALWLAAPPGAQQLYTEMESQAYFVPPYVGPRGWLGIELDKVPWVTVAKRVREAFAEAAPKSVLRSLPADIVVPPPSRLPTPQEIDPFLRPRVRKVLERLDRFCATLPETVRSATFGSPTWKAGSKSFAALNHYGDRLTLSAWTGIERQVQLIADPRYRIPAYMGHNGWIELDLEGTVDWPEIEGLVLESYRHFALKRMLQALEVRAR